MRSNGDMVGDVGSDLKFGKCFIFRVFLHSDFVVNIIVSSWSTV